MSDAQHDVIVIGGGPGGYAAALYGASAGLDVALVERHLMGGTCLNVGCIPAKELLETASVYRSVRDAADFGVLAPPPSVDWSVVLDRKQRVIDRLKSGLSSMLGQRNVTVYEGNGSLVPRPPDADASDPAAFNRQVLVTADGESAPTVIEAAAVIIATGSVPRSIKGFDVDGVMIVTSDHMFSLNRLPLSAAVIGGGAIGCEFASLLGDLGVDVTVVEALPNILAGCDPDIAKIVRRSFRKRGIKVHTGAEVQHHEPRSDGSGTVVVFEEDMAADVDLVVLAVGRQPMTQGLGLEEAGVQVDARGFVAADERCRTSAPQVWAVGDVIDTPQLAHTAFAEGMLAVSDILGEAPHPLDHLGTPWCIYCHPEVAFAGHTEASARAAGYDVVTSTHRHVGNGRAQILGEIEGAVKVIAQRLPDGTGGRILGVHMAGPWVTEQLGQAYLALNWEATAQDVARLIQPHPTMSELFGEAALSLTGRSLHA